LGLEVSGVGCRVSFFLLLFILFYVRVYVFRGICFWLRISFLGVRVFFLSCGFRVSGSFRSFRGLNSHHRRILELVLQSSPAGCALRLQVAGFGFPDVFPFSFWFRVSEIVVSVLDFGFRVSGFEFSDFWFWVFGFRVSGFRFQVVWWGVRVEVEGSMLNVCGFSVEDEGLSIRPPHFRLLTCCVVLSF